MASRGEKSIIDYIIKNPNKKEYSAIYLQHSNDIKNKWKIETDMRSIKQTNYCSLEDLWMRFKEVILDAA